MKIKNFLIIIIFVSTDLLCPKRKFPALAILDKKIFYWNKIICRKNIRFLYKEDEDVIDEQKRDRLVIIAIILEQLDKRDNLVKRYKRG